MKINIRLIRKDRLNNEECILTEAPALLNGNRLLYSEAGGAVHSVSFNKNEIILERRADIASRTILRKGGSGKSFIDSEYGRMELETKLRRCEKNDTFWLVEYQVLSGDETVLDQILIWEIDSQPTKK